MKTKLSLLLLILVFIISLCSCSNGDNKVTLKDDSKVVATVGDVSITQQQLDNKKMETAYSGQEKVFSDIEVLDDIINGKLLLIKAKEFKIKVSDDEVKDSYQEILKCMSYVPPVKDNMKKIDKKTLEGLRNVFIIQKTKEKLGSDIDQTLKQLRQQVKIKYYNREGAVSKEQALEMIQPVIDSLVEEEVISVPDSTATNLLELYIDDAFEKMGLQAFAAIGEQDFIGNFLVIGDEVCYAFGPLDNTCVADIDRDGVYELLDILGFGSGIYRIELTAYKLAVPVWSSSFKKELHEVDNECFVPNMGYDELIFEKVDDYAVKLWGVEWVDVDSQTTILKKTTDYGLLQSNGSDFFILEDYDNFPFKSWSSLYDQ